MLDAIVVGGGIVGCATALRLLQARPAARIALLEKESGLALHQSSRNSGVIHSGLYYRPGSRKALACRAGYRKLLDYCARHEVPHEICGKVVVATSREEIPRLDELQARGAANGLLGVKRLTADGIREIEPSCSGLAGLHVPETGIVDFGSLARRFGDDIRRRGAEIVFDAEVVGLRSHPDRVEVIANDRAWTARAVVVCAGLQSTRLARRSEPHLPLCIIPFRGEYYTLTEPARRLVNHLIYPVPDPNFPFLGVHFTRMIGGGVECGPNAVLAFGLEAYDKYSVNPADMWEVLSWPGAWKVARRHWRSGIGEFHRSISKAAFVTALQRLVPEIRDDHLRPAEAGIRAQACTRDGVLLDDFDVRISGRILHVCNAPSPAATASLAIGGMLAERVGAVFE